MYSPAFGVLPCELCQQEDRVDQANTIIDFDTDFQERPRSLLAGICWLCEHMCPGAQYPRSFTFWRRGTITLMRGDPLDQDIRREGQGVDAPLMSASVANLTRHLLNQALGEPPTSLPRHGIL